MKKRIKLALTFLKEKWYYVVIFIVTYAAFSFLFFNYSDVTPATEEDYQKLEETAKTISLDTRFLDSDTFDLEFGSKECRITVTYDQNFEVLKIDREDKATSMVYAIFAILFLGTASGIILCIILNEVLYRLELLYNAIKEKMKRILS